MTSISNYLYAIHTHFSSWFEHSKSVHYHAEPKTVQALLYLAALLLVIATLGYWVSGYHWAFTHINGLSTQIPTAFLHHLTNFGDGTFILALILFFHHKKLPVLLSILLVGVVGGVVSQSLKHYFDTDRPPAALEVETFNLIGRAYYSQSFPSGHTLTAFMVASTLICFEHRRWAQGLLILLAFGVGLSRVWLGIHWPIDTLVGGALGIFVGTASACFAMHWYKSVRALWPLITIGVLAIACISALTGTNDYHYAQAMMSITAILALWRTSHFFLVPNRMLSSPATQFVGHQTLNQAQILFFVIVFAVTIYRITAIGQSHVSLFYDEAYYYHWSLTPDFGYYSKPPMVAWCIHLFTSLLGDNILAVKIAAPIFYSASAWVIYLIARRIANTESAVVAGLIFLSAPIIGFNSLFITTDAPLIFFWSLSLYFFIQAIAENRWSHWILLGIFTGLGMLSKYTMAVLPASLFLCMFVDTNLRRHLMTSKPWVAAIIAGMFFSLNLYWNSQNHWIAFLHTQEISQQGENTLNIRGLVEFLAGQLIVFGPLWSWYALKKIRGSQHTLSSTITPNYAFVPRVLAFATLGILVVISLQALSSRAFINWAAPWIVGASLWLGLQFKLNAAHIPLLRRACVAHLLLLSMFYHWPQLLNHLHIEATRKNNPYHRLEGWEEVAAQLIPVMAQYPTAILASDSRDLLAYLGFHAQIGANTFARWNLNTDHIRDHYDLKYNFSNYTGSNDNFIFVSKDPLSPKILARFDTSRSLKAIEHQALSDKRLHIYVYHVQGFNGYDK